MHKTIISEMFSQRGYTNIEVKDNCITALRDEDVICAYTDVIDKLVVGHIKNIIKNMKDNKIKQGIIIYQDSHSSISTIVNSAIVSSVLIEIFSVFELQFNITKHVLVPKHTVINKEEAKKLKDYSLPIILRTDPIVRFYDFKRGDIVKIERPSGICAFRLVK